jgi:hypothetical protein
MFAMAFPAENRALPGSVVYTKGNLASLGRFQTGKTARYCPLLFKGNLASLGRFQTGKTARYCPLLLYLTDRANGPPLSD